MYKKYRNQRGSAHVIIIVVLVIALIGALGVVFYQNFMNKHAQQNTQSTQQSSSSRLTTVRFTYNGEIYALDYPQGWSESVPDRTTDERDMLIASPNQKVQVQFHVSSGGLGGMCDTNDGLKVRYYHVSDSTNTKLTDEPLRLVEAMSDYLGGGYSYSIGLSPEGAETHAAVGDSHCTVGYVGVASRVVIDIPSNTMIKPTIIARIHFPELPDAQDAKVKSMDVIKDLMKTEDYKAAVKILESARKE